MCCGKGGASEQSQPCSLMLFLLVVGLRAAGVVLDSEGKGNKEGGGLEIPV